MNDKTVKADSQNFKKSFPYLTIENPGVWPLLFVFITGVSGLFYELAWLQQLQLMMGHTVYSMSITLAAYLSGLALGALFAPWLIKKLEKQGISPWLMYFASELFLAIYGLCFAQILQAAQFPYEYWARFQGDQMLSPWILGLGQFVVGTWVVGVPTLIMGTSLPFLMRAMASSKIGPHGMTSSQAQGPGRWANTGHSGWNFTTLIYSVNTMGATLGCLLGGFLILPFLGLNQLQKIAVLGNLSILAIGSFLISTSQRKEFRGDMSDETSGHSLKKYHQEVTGQIKENDKLNYLYLIYVVASGFLCMLTQMIWNRMLSLSWGPSIYIFPIVTTAVLLGLGLSALWVSHKKALTWAHVKGSILLSLVMLALTQIVITQFPWVALWFHTQWANATAWQYHGFTFFVSMAVLTPSAFTLGILFPATLRLVGEEVPMKTGSSGHIWQFGLLYGLNIFGLFLAAILGSFILFPRLGIEKSSTAMFLLLLVLVSWPFVREKTQHKKEGNHHESRFLLYWPWVRVAPLVFVGLIFISQLPKWNWITMTSGYFYNRNGSVSQAAVKDLGYLDQADYLVQRETELVDVIDDPHATLSVHRSLRTKDDLAFKVNGKVDGNNSSDLMTTQFVALLPLLFGSDFEKTLTIGLGVGSTASELLQLPHVNRSVVVELSSAMVQYGRKYFTKTSGPLWTDSRVKIVQQDGRNYLKYQQEQFDLIVSEPSNPWVAGVGNLFTKEYYESVAKRLTPEGVASLWFHTYGLDCLAVKSVIGAASEVFAQVHVFRLGGDLFMLATNSTKRQLGPIRDRDLALEQKLFAVASIYGGSGSKREQYEKFLEKTYLFENQGAKQYVFHAKVNSDENQYLQYHSGLTFFQNISCNDFPAFNFGNAVVQGVLSQILQGNQWGSDLRSPAQD